MPSLSKKTPEELLKVLADYEELIAELHSYAVQNLQGIKGQSRAKHLDISEAHLHKIKTGTNHWTPSTAKRAIQLVKSFEEIKEMMYTYTTKQHLVDFQTDELAKMLGFDSRDQFRRTKYDSNSWNFGTITKALELAKEWNKRVNAL